MVITEVRVKLCEENNERLLAFCSVTLDNAFVIRDLKVIEGTRGMFVAMPSRKLTDRCTRCGCKNHLRARFCNQCGGRMDEGRAMRDADGRAKLHADIAHPIHASARELVQAAVVKTYFDEKDKAKLPGYVFMYDDYDAEYDVESYTAIVSEMTAARKAAPEGYRTDAPHGQRGAHAPANQETPAPETTQNRKRDFGSGIL